MLIISWNSFSPCLYFKRWTDVTFISSFHLYAPIIVKMNNVQLTTWWNNYLVFFNSTSLTEVLSSCLPFLKRAKISAQFYGAQQSRLNEQESMLRGKWSTSSADFHIAKQNWQFIIWWDSWNWSLLGVLSVLPIWFIFHILNGDRGNLI